MQGFSTESIQTFLKPDLCWFADSDPRQSFRRSKIVSTCFCFASQARYPQLANVFQSVTL